MPRRTPAEQLDEIERVVQASSGGVSAPEIASALTAVPPRTLQYRLKRLVDDGRLVRNGSGRWARYSLPESGVILSPAGVDLRRHLSQPEAARQPVGYNRDFLSHYRPNESYYLSGEERTRLAEAGRRQAAAEPQPAGTYARQVLSRLLVDLSWNSSRLEGNTYSLLDTKRLIEFGQEAAGGDRLEAQMILNHKDAVEFLVENAAEVDFNRYTVLNLHAILANNLLQDPAAAGRLRRIAVGIARSVYRPPETPQLIEECFDQLLATAAAIGDPFEQAFFTMVHVPYLQPFDDVNKRVSRVAANLPFVKANLVPLSFTDVPRGLYADAVLGVYELNRIDLLKDVFIWAYERSVARYASVRQSVGEPDPFRLRHRESLRTLVAEVVRGRKDRRSAVDHIAAWAGRNIPEADRETFRGVAEDELLGLHEGNFARYAIRPAEFAAWREIW